MKSHPVLIGILVGIILVLIGVGVSFSWRIRKLSVLYREETSKNIEFHREIERLKQKISSFKEKEEDLRRRIKSLQQELFLCRKRVDELKEEKLEGKQEESVPRTTENHGCEAVDECISKDPKGIPQSHGFTPVVRGLLKEE